MSDSRDFDPYLAADALQGITESIYWFLTEGPGAEQLFARNAHSSLIGLAWAARSLARQLNDYFRALDEAGVELPKRFGANNDGVKETPAAYTLN